MAYSLKIVGEFRRTPCVILGRDVQNSHEATGRRVDPRPPKFFLRYSTHPNLKSSQQAFFDTTFAFRVISNQKTTHGRFSAKTTFQRRGHNFPE